MDLWRITTGSHPIWSGEGARLRGQRWNPPGMPAIYCGASYAICLLEILVHANRKQPPSAAKFVRAVVPEAVSSEYFTPADHPGWDDLTDPTVAQAFGKAWLQAKRSALLFVPSVITKGLDLNVVVNPQHPDFKSIKVGPETPIDFDRRLF